MSGDRHRVCAGGLTAALVVAVSGVKARPPLPATPALQRGYLGALRQPRTQGSRVFRGLPLTCMSAVAADFSSEIDNVPLWVADKPLLPGFQERATVEVCCWWQLHDCPAQVARFAANSSVGTILQVYTVPGEKLAAGDEDEGDDEPIVVMQASMRVQLLRSRVLDGLQVADVQLMPDMEEVSAHLDLAVHALGTLETMGSWLEGQRAESVVRFVAQAAAASTARSWNVYESSKRIGSFKYGVTELVRMNRSVDTFALSVEAFNLARCAALQAARLASMRWGSAPDVPAGWLADGPAGSSHDVTDGAEEPATKSSRAEPVHVRLAARAAARFLSKRVQGVDTSTGAGGGASDQGDVDADTGMEVTGGDSPLSDALRSAEWDLWLAIDSVWFLLSKLSSKQSLLLPDEVLQLQPPPPPGGWEHQYCMQQGSPAVSTTEWSFDEAYPLLRRAQRLSFVASSLMPGAQQQQILEIDRVVDRLRFLESIFRRHELALRSLVALQEIETKGKLTDFDDDASSA